MRELTPRETEIADMAASGMTSSQIASATGLASGTVQNYLHRVYQALEIDGHGARVRLANVRRDGVDL